MFKSLLKKLKDKIMERYCKEVTKILNLEFDEKFVITGEEGEWWFTKTGLQSNKYDRRYCDHIAQYLLDNTRKVQKRN